VLCGRADIVVAARLAQMGAGDWIKPGAVIDVGINRIEKPDGGGTRLVGEDYESCALLCSWARSPCARQRRSTIAYLLAY
jgi:methylenetetrahydrofolate dehydrogenase (NADP+)/methenyltetrahydrofolate cyclohydrolase